LFQPAVSYADSTIPVERLASRLVDDANLLTSSEEAELLEKLDEISERQQCDVVIVTVNSLGGKTAQDYADDFYDYNGYGFGKGRDGMLLLVSMGTRDWYISTTGFGAKAITDAGIEYISEKFVSDLSGGYYADAFNTYAKLCDSFITQAKEGNPYDVGQMPKASLPWMVYPMCLIVGIIIAFIATLTMKGQLETVRFQAAASDYMKKDGVHLTGQRERFLYRNVTRIPIPQKSSGGRGGSSMHHSSSGRSHGGGGGKF
jgi:uncharacterized protein